MLGLFKSKGNTVAVEPKKTVNQIIEEIHESFFTEVDKLLKEANVSRSLDTDKQDLIDKCTRLQRLGFNNTKEVQEATVEISRLNVLKQENESKKGLIEAINYFSFKYPNYKFITNESVKKICEKYGLIYGQISSYTGTVPDKNLKHIEDFTISEEDMVYFRINYDLRGRRSDVELIDYSEYNASKGDIQRLRGFYGNSVQKASLQIAAPQKDFATQGMEVKDYQLSKIEVPDPVVLQPVLYNKKRYYLIVTAWGLEASDENVINEKFN